jgi:hypothetical protein
MIGQKLGLIKEVIITGRTEFQKRYVVLFVAYQMPPHL